MFQASLEISAGFDRDPFVKNVADDMRRRCQLDSMRFDPAVDPATYARALTLNGADHRRIRTDEDRPACNVTFN